MWQPEFDRGRADRVPGRPQPDPNLDRLLSLALGAAVAVFLASLVPPPLFAAMLSRLLFWAALGAMLFASLRGERVWSDSLTGWDQAAAYLLLSQLSDFFVDAEAAAAALMSLQGSAAS